MKPERTCTRVCIAFQVKDFESVLADGKYIQKKEARRLDEYMKYILYAGKKALEDAGLGFDGGGRGEGFAGLDMERCGTIVGSAMGGMSSFSGAVETLVGAGHRRMNPFCIPYAMTNGGTALLGQHIGFMGPNYSIATACATGNYCILNAMQHIKRGSMDVMLCGASDTAVLPIGMAGFTACKALSTNNGSPQTASRPWCTSRDGFVMGEGCGVLLIESLEHCIARGAEDMILAELAGGAYSCDAYHLTEPRADGMGVQRCIENSLRSAAVSAHEVDYVNAHATSTPAGDIVEYRAIINALSSPVTASALSPSLATMSASATAHAGAHTTAPPLTSSRDAAPHVLLPPALKMNSTKSMIGHLLGAAGAVEAVAVVKAIQTGILHPNCNISNLDPEVDSDIIVGDEALKHDVNVAISNSFGFGGHNSALVFKKYEH